MDNGPGLTSIELHKNSIASATCVYPKQLLGVPVEERGEVWSKAIESVNGVRQGTRDAADAPTLVLNLTKAKSRLSCGLDIPG